MHLGQFRKVRATDDAFTQSGKALAGVVVGHTFFGFDKDVACARLLNRRLIVTAAFVEQFHNMEAIGTAQDVGGFARLQWGKRFQKNRRQTA